MDYGNTLKRAAEIVWRHKFLWALGFLVALGGGGGGGNANFNFNTFSGSEGGDLPEFGQAFTHLQEFFVAYAVILLLLGCVVVILGLVLWLARLTAEAGLVDAVNKIETGKQSGFGAAMSAGAAVLPRMIGLKIILALPIILIIILIILMGAGLFGGAISAAFSESAAGLGAVLSALALFISCLIPLICVIFLLAIVIYFIDLFAVRGIVTHDLGVIAAIQHSWRTLRENPVELIVTALILMVIGVLFGLAVAAIMAPLILLFIAPAIFSLIASGSVSFGVLATTGVGFLCLGVFGALLNAIWLAYQSTVFTLAYRHVDGGKGKLVTH